MDIAARYPHAVGPLSSRSEQVPLLDRKEGAIISRSSGMKQDETMTAILRTATCCARCCQMDGYRCGLTRCRIHLRIWSHSRLRVLQTNLDLPSGRSLHRCGSCERLRCRLRARRRRWPQSQRSARLGGWGPGACLEYLKCGSSTSFRRLEKKPPPVATGTPRGGAPQAAAGVDP